MKIRHGFVSNSSTTSFLIYGTSIEYSEEDFFEEEDEDVIEWVKNIKSRDAELYNKVVQARLSYCQEEAKLNKYYLDDVETCELMLKVDNLTDEESNKLRENIESEPFYFVGGELFGMDIHSAPWGETYVGLDWSSVKDDETGADFKGRARKLVYLLFNKTQLETLSHAWRD